jgi:hypothetical protein
VRAKTYPLTFMRCTTTKLLLAASLLLTVSTSSASGQVATGEKALSPVRPEDQAALIHLVNDYLRFQQSQHWGNLYDILSTTYTRGEPRYNFIERLQSASIARQYMVILDFSLKRTFINEPFNSGYGFYGCANVLRDGKKQISNTHIEVVLEKGVWRVSSVGLFVTCMSSELECKSPH